MDAAEIARENLNKDSEMARILEQVNSSVAAMFETFGALFARHSDIKPQHLGGAVKIMDVYYRLFNSEQGWRLAKEWYGDRLSPDWRPKSTAEAEAAFARIGLEGDFWKLSV